jgi:6-phospho-beta-glucosidase
MNTADRGMKLCIIGGGGFRVPLIYRALAAEPFIDQVWLYDIARERLSVVENVLRQLRSPRPVQVHVTTVLDEAVAGSDFVFSAVRVGGLAGRVADERAAIGLGLLGQETTGAGGIAYGLRTIPAAMHIAARVRALAPSAIVINFTNPVGMITEAMQRVLGDRVIGICDTPSGLGARVAGLLGVRPELVRLDYAGLNHLGWLRGAWYQGRDLVQELLNDDRALELLEETQVFGADWLRTLGLIPNEYLHYYYNSREAVQAARGGKETRGEYLRRQQEDFYRYASAHPDDALNAWDRTLSAREATYMEEARPAGSARPAGNGGGYEQIALGIIHAIASDKPATLIVNVRNGGTLPGLPPDAVVEVPCEVRASSVRPLGVTAPAGAELGLIQQVKAIERLTIEAALDRDPGLAVQALALHPLIASVAVARELLAAYRRSEPGLFAPAEPLPG